MVGKFCFGTLAVGKRYRTHAKMLAKDIQEQAPNVTFIVLTDRPADFIEYTHVIPIKHRLKSIKGYHDKRFVIEKAFERFDTCIFIDSDMRIIGPVPERLEFLPGITARTGCMILKFNAATHPSHAPIKQVAKILDIDLQEAKWFHEFMFVVTKQAGAEKVFLKVWEAMSYFFEKQGIYDGEGSVMGLAAVKAGLTVRFDSEDRFPFFKDKIEQVRIEKGQSDLKDKQIYFEIHKEIEFPKHLSWLRIVNKLTRKVGFFSRLLKLRYFVNPNFDEVERLSSKLRQS